MKIRTEAGVLARPEHVVIGSAMTSVPFQRDRSWVEVLAILLALCATFAVMLALSETIWFFFTDPFLDAWLGFVWCWERAFVAVVALLTTLASARWLPQPRSLRWAGLALAIGAAALLGWLAEDRLTSWLAASTFQMASGRTCCTPCSCWPPSSESSVNTAGAACAQPACCTKQS